MQRSITEKIIIIGIYILAAIVLFPHFRYFIQVDTLQYIVIAEKYSNGFFSEAINSYWSPLFSWGIALLIKAGIEPFAATKILQIIVGGFALSGILALLGTGCDPKWLRYVFLFSFVPVILSYALLWSTPDLLFLSLAVGYLVLLMRGSTYAGNKYSFIVFGCLGALLYFSKSAGFVFFILSFTLVNCLFWVRNASSRSKLVSGYFLTLLVFLSISSLWIFAISRNEGQLLLSSSASYNFKLIGPKSNPEVMGEIHHPYEQRGLMPPHEDRSLSAWEDPHSMYLPKWSPFDDSGSFAHFLKIIVKNMLSLRSFYFGKDSGSVIIFGLIFLFILCRKEIINSLNQNYIPLIVALSCTLLYLPVFVMDRYLWINNVVLALMAVSVFRPLAMINSTMSGIFILLFSLAAIAGPLQSLYGQSGNCIDIADDTKSLQGFITGRAASVRTPGENPGENYLHSSLVSYLSGCKYYGMMGVQEDVKDMLYEWRGYNIEFMISWNDSFALPDSLYSDSIHLSQSDARIYKLNY